MSFSIQSFSLLLSPFGSLETDGSNITLTPNLAAISLVTGQPIHKVAADALAAGGTHDFYSNDDEIGFVSGNSETISRPPTLEGAIFAIGEFLSEYSNVTESLFFDGETVTDADLRRGLVIPTADAFFDTFLTALKAPPTVSEITMAKGRKLKSSALKGTEGARVSFDIRNRIIKARLLGETFQGIADSLNADKIPTTKNGKMWYAGYVHSIIMNS